MNPPPPFKELASYKSVNMSNQIQVSVEGKENWIDIGHKSNIRLIQHLLQIRLDRRLIPTNADSASIINRYGYGTLWACEKRYLDGAIMIIKCKYKVMSKHVDELVKKTRGVGKKVKVAILELLGVTIVDDLDDDEDDAVDVDEEELE